MLRKLVLFDVDGTLIATRGAGRRAIHAALLQEIGAGESFAGVPFDGKTDPQIVRELLVQARVPGPSVEGAIAGICARYLGLLAAELAGGPPPRVFPGVAGLLDRLAAAGDVLVGLLTGNLVEGARLKLDAAGLPFARFGPGAFGSDHHERARLPAIAVERALPAMGRRPVGHEVVIIGDTPADMTCGRAIGARGVGVATGSFGADELLAAGAYAVVPDFSDPEPVLTAIYA